nr:MAG TPA: hypothetical protein [Caudoviricetes sp.]
MQRYNQKTIKPKNHDANLKKIYAMIILYN